MKNPPVTLKTIGKALNMSVSTVSRALNDMQGVGNQTRAAVLQLASELDYQPNQLAANLVHSRTKTIGVLVPSLGYHFYASLLNSIEEAALAAGYNVLVCQSNESHLREIVNIQNLMRSQVEGFLIAFARDTSCYEHIERLVKRNFPLVLFDRYTESIAAAKVVIDNHAAAFNATEHLIENGCARIAFLAGPANMLISNERLAGYRAALAKHGLSAREEYLLHGDFTPEVAIAQTQLLMRLPQPPDGLLVVSDRVAFPTMHALKELEVRIPEDLALVSFNNEPFAALLTPGLTSVSQPYQEMAVECVRLLLEQMREGTTPVPVQTKVLNSQLIVRGSSLRRRPANE